MCVCHGDHMIGYLVSSQARTSIHGDEGNIYVDRA